MTPPVELVAADLDGTLVQLRRPPSARVVAALRACREQGVGVVAVTARRWTAAAPLLRELEIGPLAIVAGGTELRDVRTGRLIETRLLREGVVAAACRRILESGLQPMVATGGEGFRAGPAGLDGPAAARYLRRAGVGRVPLSHLGARPATRVLAMGSRSRIELAARRCAGLPARRTVQGCIVPLDPGGETPFELHVAAADKGDGLRAVCHHLGVAPARTLAIGDSAGDLPMLEAAGVAVVMGQAEPGMRRHGFVVAPPVEQDGAAAAIERLVLG